MTADSFGATKAHSPKDMDYRKLLYIVEYLRILRIKDIAYIEMMVNQYSFIALWMHLIFCIRIPRTYWVHHWFLQRRNNILQPQC